jgi:hypothetical protein
MRFWAVILLGWMAWTATAQNAGAPPVPPQAALPPLPPPPQSPIDLFRDLLATNEVGRAALLTNRTAQQQTLIRTKLAEYLILPANERELRLTVTELRWYLLPFLGAPATNRTLFFAHLPAKYGPLITERLRQWDQLPAELREVFLKNEAALGHLLRLSVTPANQQQEVLATLPPTQRQRVEAAFEQWRRLTPGTREAVTAQFNQFFELSDQEKERALRTFALPERQQMERTLAAFERLPREARERCIASFARFASMPAEQQQQFLRNATRWVEMTPAERQSWRELVKQPQALEIFPPMPPGLVPFPGKVATLPAADPVR